MNSNSDFQTVQQTQASISNLIRPVQGERSVFIRDALNQVLASDILSPIDVPAHDNSAMDGYALNGNDIQIGDITKLKICGTALAGKPYSAEVPRGGCVKITTGAVMPQGCDTVIIQENVKLDGDSISFPPGAVQRGENRRCCGEDLAKGKPALKAGKVISPADLGLMASLGIAEVRVKRNIRVAFFSTGDELRSLGQPLDSGCIYDSNRYTIYGMLKRLSFVDMIDMGVIEDSPAALKKAMQAAADQADVIITSGGVSVGEADYTKQVMSELGSVNFWKIAMRPGRPMAFGNIGRTTDQETALLFGLPGNPVAVMVTFYAFVREALHKLAGAHCKPLPSIRAKMANPVRKKGGRTEYQRVSLHREDGDWVATLTGAQGSGILRSMSESDGLLILDHEQGSLEAGDYANVTPFFGLI